MHNRSQLDPHRQLTKHFKLSEFVKSAMAIRNGIDNTPPPHIVDALALLCERVLEPIREALGPVIVTSGYRCLALNRLAKGSDTSQHVKGEAADIEIVGVDNDALGDWIQKNIIEWDQLIYEFTNPPRALNVPPDPNAGWIHVSYTTGRNRRMVLKKG